MCLQAISRPYSDKLHCCTCSVTQYRRFLTARKHSGQGSRSSTHTILHMCGMVCRSGCSGCSRPLVRLGATEVLLHATQTAAALQGQALNQDTFTRASSTLMGEISAQGPSRDARHAQVYRQELAVGFLYKLFLTAQHQTLAERFQSAVRMACVYVVVWLCLAWSRGGDNEWGPGDTFAVVTRAPIVLAVNARSHGGVCVACRWCRSLLLRIDLCRREPSRSVQIHRTRRCVAT